MDTLRYKLGNIVETLSEISLDMLYMTEIFLFESDADVHAALRDNFVLYVYIEQMLKFVGGGLVIFYNIVLLGIRLVPSDPVSSFELLEVILHLRSQVT